MKLLLALFALMFVLAGCGVRLAEGDDSPFERYVGRHADVRRTVVVYDRGPFGRLGVPVGEWPVSKNEKVAVSLAPGESFEVIEVASRRIESGKHYYFACRYRTAGEDVIFDYPAEEKFIGADYLSWR